MIDRRKNFDPLLYWVVERNNIRLKKVAGLPAPWTDDPILQKYRFCNVMRSSDRVSQWLIENVLNFQGEFDDQLVFLKWVSLCRWVNWPPALAEVMESDCVTYDKIDLGRIAKFLQARILSGSKAWTGAYMVRAPSKKVWGDMSKGKFVAEIVVGKGLDDHKDAIFAALKTNSVREAVQAFAAVPNWGQFMAGQIVADLTYTPLLGEAVDLNTWAPMGPGSKRGYNRLLGLPLKQKPPPEEVWCAQLQEWRKQIVAMLGKGYDCITLHDVQNCLCEVDKYLRAKNGEGRPRSTYKPETAY